MLRRIKRLAMAALLAGLAMALLPGCSKYDTLERNMQYVSDDLVRQDAGVSYNNVVKAHERWRSAGGGHEADNQAYRAYQDAYAQYAIVYNELWDRKDGGFSGHLHGATDELPPPPPGMSAAAKAPATKSEPAVKAPPARELPDSAPAAPAGPSSGIPMPSAKPAAAAPAAAVSRANNPFVAPGSGAETSQQGKAPAKVASSGGERYVIAPGDTLRAIAKRHGITEKSLMEANGLTDPDHIAAGKALTLPAR